MNRCPLCDVSLEPGAEECPCCGVSLGRWSCNWCGERMVDRGADRSGCCSGGCAAELNRADRADALYQEEKEGEFDLAEEAL
jgi:hypothetical protein